ncbi:3-hydroxyacyl-CoA dehydrogenase family protein [Thermodesulfobacteriota bacterium]
MEIQKVGVVGCGIMGSGITQVCATSGFDVTVTESKDELLKKGLSSIDYWLQKSVDKGRLSDENKSNILGRIHGTINIDDLMECDIIIEAVFDNLEVKRTVFTQLDKVCPEHTVLVSNTSTLAIIDIASATTRMDKVLGMHFFNPVPAMKLVEVIKSIATSDETLAIGKEFGAGIGKTVVVAPDVPGFIVNRISSPQGIQAVIMLENGLATAEDIDTAVKLGSNVKMGPLERFDLIGLDTLLEGWGNLYKEYKDTKYAPPLLLKRMVAAGWLGRKSGRGFYTYDKDGNIIKPEKSFRQTFSAQGYRNHIFHLCE